MKTLVIVESPTKAKTLRGFLPVGTEILASFGHIRDLPKKSISIDRNKSYEPTYEISPEKRDIVAHLIKAVTTSDKIILATDPDREGEAIAWHLYEIFKKSVPNFNKKEVVRASFHEITKRAVQEAMDHTSEINLDLVAAQETRRIIDRLIGYEISPVLSRTAKEKGLSAGRVQTPAVMLVCQREDEIFNFKVTTSFSLDALLSKYEDKNEFTATLVERRGKAKQFERQDDAENIITELKDKAFSVAGVDKSEVLRKPSPPFITSTLQQAAIKRLGIPPEETMKIAQQLFEGITLDGQNEGLITYMRTDSVVVSVDSQKAAKEYIEKTFGKQYAPARPNIYTTSTKSAQEAHEAIRPTAVDRTPDSIKRSLNGLQFSIYDMIWKRFVASQMSASVSEATTVMIDVDKTNHKFQARGSIPVFDGYKKVYFDEDESENKDRLPPLADKDALDVKGIAPKEHKTKPPPRYTEATLIAALEKDGIGRPSTYASILNNIKRKGYVNVKGKKREMESTSLGRKVVTHLIKAFPDIFDLKFTSAVEDDLDRVAEGKMTKLDALKEFDTPYLPRLKAFEKQSGWQPYNQESTVSKPAEKTDKKCPKCGGMLVKRTNRSTQQQFLGCSKYPNCKYTESLPKTGDKT